MKYTLAAIIVLITSTITEAQTILDTTLIMGRLKSNYFIFDIPKNPEGNGLALLNTDEYVYIINMVSTTRNSPQDLWYHCYYKSLEGYIPVSMIDIYGNWSTEKLEYLKANKDKPFIERLSITKRVCIKTGNMIDSVEKREKAIQDSLSMVLDNALSKIVTAMAVCAKKNKILIVGYSYPVNILGYPGFEVRFVNGANKSIKYVTFKIIAYNPVNDPEATKEVKCIGEVRPFENAIYKFEDVFISKVTDHYSIPTIKIQYMDNTTITLSGTQVFADYFNSHVGELDKYGALDKALDQLAITGK